MIGIGELMIVLLIALLVTALGNKGESGLFLARMLISLLNRPTAEQGPFPTIEVKDHAPHERSS